MHPVLFRIGPFTLHTYGVFVAAAFFLSIGLAMREARRRGLDPDRMLDLAFWVTLSAIVGARLLFIVVEYRYFLEHPLRVFKIWEGGLVFYGGFLLATAAALVFTRRYGLDPLEVGDVVAPALAAGQAVGRLGCLSAGCCYGKPTQVPWGITFTDPNSLVPLQRLGVPLHPTQLYSSLGNLVLFLVLWAVLRRRAFRGQVLCLYGILYPLFRSTVEFFRGDPRGSILGGTVSTSQAVSAAVLVVSAVAYLRLRRRRG